MDGKAKFYIFITLCVLSLLYRIFESLIKGYDTLNDYLMLFFKLIIIAVFAVGFIIT